MDVVHQPAYSTLTLFAFWVEPFYTSTVAATVQGVSVAVALKLRIGFFELLFTMGWFLLPTIMLRQIYREFDTGRTV